MSLFKSVLLCVAAAVFMIGLGSFVGGCCSSCCKSAPPSCSSTAECGPYYYTPFYCAGVGKACGDVAGTGGCGTCGQ